jgi:hypothetical protein
MSAQMALKQPTQRGNAMTRTIKRRSVLETLAAAGASLALPALVRAQDSLDTLKIIVGYPPPPPPPNTIRTTNLDMSGQSGWEVRNVMFNGCRINAANSSGGKVINCIFNDCPSAGMDGSAVNLNGATNLLIANCDFNRCSGNVVAQYQWDNVTVDGCHFIDCAQCVSMAQSNSTSIGRNIKFIRCVFLRATVAGIESTGDGDGIEGYLSNYVVDSCWFADFGPNQVGAVGPISCVCRRQVGSKWTNNYFRLGPYKGWYLMAIEESVTLGNGPEISGNLFDGPWSDAILQWDSMSNIHDNKYWQCNPPGNSRNETVLTSAPAEPPWPTRIAY